MTSAVQHRKGTTAEHATFTGLEGEVTIDTTKDTAVIHDGSTVGGFPLAKENLANFSTSGLSTIDGASTASDDKFLIYDQSATSLKTITRAELNNAMEQDALANVAITGGTIDGTTIGATTASTGAFTTLTTSSTVTHNGGTANGVAYLNGSKVLTTGSALTFDGSSMVLNTSTSSNALRITQTGTGNALLVEDSANPDSTPFVIDSSGREILGYTSTLTVNNYAGNPAVPARQQISTTGAATSTLQAMFAATNYAVGNIVAKSRGTTVGDYTVVNNGDRLYSLNIQGADGTAFIPAADISAYVDGTPGTNDMPGRLVFSTTADGASSPTERMRIDSAGQTKFSYNTVVEVSDNTNAALRITQTGTGNALLVEDSANPDSSPFVIDASGKVFTGNTSSFYGGGGTTTPQIQVLGIASGDSSIGATYFGTSSTSGGILNLNRSNGAIGTQSIVSSGDMVGRVDFRSSDGTGLIGAARIEAYVDGTPGTNDMPGRLVFSTTADGASSPTERMRINSSGNVGIGTSSPTERLQVLNGANSTVLLGYSNGEGVGYRLRSNVSTTADGGFNIEYNDGTDLYRVDHDGGSGFHAWYMGGSERMRIDSSGNVGIGTSSPLVKTQIDIGATSGEALRLSCTVDPATQQTVSLGFATSVASTNPAALIQMLEYDASDSRADLVFYTRGANSDSAPTEAIRLTSGQGLTISRTAVTSPASTDGNVFSGTYTPTLTNSTNIDASTAASCQYMRVGNVVTVSGYVSIDATTTGNTVLRMSLPIASNMTSTSHLGGTFVSTYTSATQVGGSIVADTTNDVAIFQTYSPSTSNAGYSFTFTYRVL